MAHARNTIRARAKTLLQANVTLVASANIYSSHVYALDQSIDAAINITGGPEQLLTREFGERETRAFELQIMVYKQSNSNVDADLDAICEEIESTLGASPGLGIGLIDSHFTGYSAEFTDELEVPLGIATINWRCVYQIVASDPSTII